MKTKGIPFWEQHIQHIVLAIAVVVCIGFTVKQFVGSPNAVEMGTGASKITVAPGELDEALRIKGEELALGLAPDAPPPMTIPGSAEMLTQFTDGLTQLASIDGTILPTGTPHNPGRGIDGGITADRLYHVPEIAAPYSMVCQQDYASLVPEVVENLPELLEKLPQRPYDVTWTTVACAFSLEDALAQHRFEDRSDPENEILAVPPTWYGDRINILDVLVEREEFSPEKNDWTNRQLLDLLPGQFTFRPRLAEEGLGASDRDDLLSQLNEAGVQQSIVQPQFFATVGNNWVPPDPLAPPIEPDELIDPEARKLRTLRGQLRSALVEQEAVQAEIDKDCGGVSDEEDGGGRNDRDGRGGRDDRGGGGGKSGGGGQAPPGGGSEGGGGGMGSGGTKSGRGNRAEEERLRQKCKNLRSRLETVSRRVDRLQRDIERRGGNIDMAAAQQAAVDLMKADELVIWGHDIDIEQGKRYRYRFTIELYNPFFAKKLNLRDEQHQLADAMTMSSATSAWSDEIEVEPPLKFWVVDASTPRGGGNRVGKVHGDAKAEVYRFFDGRWWLDQFTVEPGQRIGEIKDQAGRGEAQKLVDFGTDWFPVDIVSSPTVTDDGAAQVLLQNLRTGELRGYIDPEAQTNDPQRQKLRDLVDQAEAEAIAMVGAP